MRVTVTLIVVDKLGKGTRKTENQRKNRDNPDYKYY